MKRKILGLLLSMVFILGTLSGCGGNNEVHTTTQGNSDIISNEDNNSFSDFSDLIEENSNISDKVDTFDFEDLLNYISTYGVDDGRKFIITGKISKIAEGPSKIYLKSNKDYETLTYFYLGVNDMHKVNVGDNVKIKCTIYKYKDSDKFYFSDCSLLEVNGVIASEIDENVSSKNESGVISMVESITSSKPESTASKPSDNSSKPTETVSKPTETTSKPSSTSSKPSETTSNSSGTNSNPFNTWDNPEQQQTTEYVLNTSTMKIHYPSCTYVAKIAPENYATTTDYNAAIAQGYQSCKKCHCH